MQLLTIIATIVRYSSYKLENLFESAVLQYYAKSNFVVSELILTKIVRKIVDLHRHSFLVCFKTN